MFGVLGFLVVDVVFVCVFLGYVLLRGLFAGGGVVAGAEAFGGFRYYFVRFL